MPKVRPREVASLLLNRRYNLLVWGYAAQTFAMGGFGFWGPTFLHRAHDMTLKDSATFFGAMLAGAGLISTFLGGMIANVLRQRSPAGYVWLMAIVACPGCAPVFLCPDDRETNALSLIGLGLSIFFIFLPTGPIVSEIFEIVPVHLRSSAMAVSMFITHLFGDFGSPSIVGHLSSHSNLQTAVLDSSVDAGRRCSVVVRAHTVHASAT